MSAPRSEQFDDVYFFAKDGLAETRHVFLDGNGLPGAWQDKSHFVIAETGFGTGLSFLAAWQLFEETARSDQSLEFISFELFPLSASQIEEYLSVWAEEFKTILPVLVKGYPSDLSGEHVIKVTERVTLRLFFGDVNDDLPRLDVPVDCWFLDGFKPASNPEMWSDIVFENVGRLTNINGSFATFTSAGVVKRGLRAAGFGVKRISGFGYKRHMLVGQKI